MPSRAKLFKFIQSASIADYYREFMELANRVKGENKEALLDCFISGLKPDLKQEVITRSLNSLLRVVSLAQLFDDKCTLTTSVARNKPVYSPSLSSFPKGGTSFNSPAPVPSSESTMPPLLPTPNTKPLPPVKKMTAAEMQLHREKGLCYTCDDRFTWNHKCQNR